MMKEGIAATAAAAAFLFLSVTRCLGPIISPDHLQRESRPCWLHGCIVLVRLRRLKERTKERKKEEKWRLDQHPRDTIGRNDSRAALLACLTEFFHLPSAWQPLRYFHLWWFPIFLLYGRRSLPVCNIRILRRLLYATHIYGRHLGSGSRDWIASSTVPLHQIYTFPIHSTRDFMRWLFIISLVFFSPPSTCTLTSIEFKTRNLF